MTAHEQLMESFEAVKSVVAEQIEVIQDLEADDTIDPADLGFIAGLFAAISLTLIGMKEIVPEMKQ